MPSLAELYARGFELGQRQRTRQIEEEFRTTQRQKIEQDMLIRGRRLTPQFRAAFERVADPDIAIGAQDRADLFMDIPSFREALSLRRETQEWRRLVEQNKLQFERQMELNRLQLQQQQSQTEAARYRAQASGDLTTERTTKYTSAQMAQWLMAADPNISLQDAQAAFPDPEAVYDKTMATSIIESRTRKRTSMNTRELRDYITDRSFRAIVQARPDLFTVGNDNKIQWKDDKQRLRWEGVIGDIADQFEGASRDEIDGEVIRKKIEGSGFLDPKKPGMWRRAWDSLTGGGTPAGDDDGAGSEGVPPSEEPDFVEPQAQTPNADMAQNLPPRTGEGYTNPAAIIEEDFAQIDEKYEFGALGGMKTSQRDELKTELWTALAMRGMLTDETRKMVEDFVRGQAGKKAKQDLSSLVNSIAGVLAKSGAAAARPGR